MKMSDEDYFAHEALSNSKLQLINPKRGGSPAKFNDGFTAQESPALIIGSFIHQLILEGEYYYQSEVTKPSGKIGKLVDKVFELRKVGHSIADAIETAVVEVDYYSATFTDKRRADVIRKGFEYYMKLKNVKQGEHVIPADMINLINRCIDAVKYTPSVYKMIHPPSLANVEVFKEEAYFMKYKPEGFDIELELKCKVDHWMVDHDNQKYVLNDLKTSGGSIREFVGYSRDFFFNDQLHTEVVEGKFTKFGYNIQMAMYWMILEHNLKQRPDYKPWYTREVNMLVVSKAYGNECAVVNVSEKQLDNGIKEFEELIKIYADYLVNGYTPGTFQV